ncbi:MAG TPA: HdeD family acid-resistance protein [Terriglobia bacterium]
MGLMMDSPLNVFRTGLHELRRNWGWILALGIALIVLGMIAIGDVVFFTVVSVIFLGWVLVFGGIVEAVQAFRHRKGGSFFLHLLSSVLAVVVGFLLLENPQAGALVLTLMLAVYFIAGGIFRIFAALTMRLPTWGWMVFNGLVTLALGILVLAHWPSSALWIIGLFIGIDLIVTGWTRVMLALAVRKLAPSAA